jgi:prepilin-type N-terminal cleavage/methylation domain-containing protein
VPLTDAFVARPSLLAGMALHDALRDGIRRVRHPAGFSALEVVATIAILGIVLRFGVPRLAGGSDLALFQSHEQLVADLRNTRADALISGDHFRLDVTSTNTYAEYRMSLDGGGNWQPATTTTRSRILPAGLTFSAGVGAQFEFNTRGLLASAANAGTVEITDGRTGFKSRVVLWPSGQVQP